MKSLKHYRVVKEDPSHFEMHDTRDNKTFKIAKKSLSPEMHEKIGSMVKMSSESGGDIPKAPELAKTPVMMAQGGEAAYPPCKNQACKSFGQPHPNCRCYGGMAKGGEVEVFCASSRPHDEFCKFFADGGPVDEVPSVNLGAMSPQELPQMPESAAPEQQAAAPAAEPAPQEQPFSLSEMAPSVNPLAGLKEQGAESQAIPEEKVPAAQVPANLGEEQAAKQSEAAAAAQGAGGGPAEAQKPQDAMSQYFAGLKKNLTDQGTAIAAGQKAIEAGYKQIAGAQQEAATLIAAFKTDHDIRVKELRDKSTALQKEVTDGKVDPNNYWDSKSTAGKVGAAIALVLGGLGGGLNKSGHNMALDVINKAIDRDIDAQRTNIQQKNNAYKLNLDNLQSENQAYAQTRLDLLSITQAKIAQQMAGIQGAQAKQQGAQLIAQIEQQKAGLEFQLGAEKTANGDQMAQYIRYLHMTGDPRAEKYAAQYVPGIGMSMTNEIPQEVRKTLIEKTAALQEADKLIDFAKKHSGLLPTSPENIALINQGKAMAFDVLNKFRTSTGQGVYKESQAEADRKLVDDNPTRFFNEYTTQPKYKVLRDSIERDLEALKKGYGLPTAAQRNSVAGIPIRPVK